MGSRITPEMLEARKRRGPAPALSVAEVRAARSAFDKGHSVNALAKEFGVSHLVMKHALLGIKAYRGVE